MPIDVPDETHLALAHEVLAAMPVISGHGGLCFTYLPDRKSPAFDLIYAWSRRMKGIDIEDLAVTLSHTATQLKPPCWLNAIGRDPTWDTALWRKICALPETSNAQVHHARFGILARLSPTLELFDSNRHESPPAAYQQYDNAIARVRLADIGTFSGARFGNDPTATTAWLSRFSAGDDS